MNAAEAQMIEETIARVIAHERKRFDVELSLVRQKVAALEHDLALDRRLADIERRLAGTDVEDRGGNVARLQRGGR